jgi:hypothetical protein
MAVHPRAKARKIASRGIQAFVIQMGLYRTDLGANVFQRAQGCGAAMHGAHAKPFETDAGDCAK